MSNILQLKQDVIKNNTSEEFGKVFFETVEGVFKKHPDLKSFGWQQWDTGTLFQHRNKVETYSTIRKADLNGNDGDLLYDKDSLELQREIEEVLSGIDSNLLRITFGDNATITVYQDLTVEAEKYDPYGLEPYEL